MPLQHPVLFLDVPHFTSTYNATYTSNGTALPATLTLLSDKAAITFATPDGNRTAYWYYYNTVQNGASGAVFSYTAYPPQLLEVLDKDLSEAFLLRLQTGRKAVLHNRNKTALVLIATLALAVAVVYFLLLPWAAQAVAARVPVAYEKKLGASLYETLVNDLQVDKNRSAYATAFFNALQIRSNYPITITVVKGDVANAFALPGGHIIVYDKLLNKLSTYPQLAALLAHEATHIEARHSLKSLLRQAGVLLVFSAFLGDAGAIGGTLLNSADQLKSLSYSRSLEKEADAAGLQLLTARNIDGTGFVQLFQILQQEPDSEGPEWTSSHPQLKNRIRAIKQQLQAMPQHPQQNETLHGLFLKLKTAD
ncbi:MAG TPA: M48 family metallopeptidase [Chitinophagaceae bacterium]|nr:M48 family metallopeptidase [Chitinophagaceae bacterium]